MCQAVARRANIDRFYEILLERYRTLVGAGHWFGQPRHYMRVGFGWPTLAELRQGLRNLTAAVDDAKVR